METIPFCHAYTHAYVAPGLHCLCLYLCLCLLLMSQCKPGFKFTVKKVLSSTEKMHFCLVWHLLSSLGNTRSIMTPTDIICFRIFQASYVYHLNTDFEITICELILSTGIFVWVKSFVYLVPQKLNCKIKHWALLKMTVRRFWLL